METERQRLIRVFGDLCLVAGTVEGQKKIFMAFPSLLPKNYTRFLTHSKHILNEIRRFKIKANLEDLDLYLVIKSKLEEAENLCLKAIAFYES